MRNTIDRYLLGISLFFAFALVFLMGGVATYFNYPPYGWIYEAHTGYLAMREKEEAYRDDNKPLPSDTAIDRSKIIHKEGAYEGYTLTSYVAGQAVLLDMDGNIVHRWEKKYSDIWRKPPHVSRPVPDTRVIWNDQQLFPNGDLLVAMQGYGDTPYGYGLVKLDKDSNILWAYESNAHHSIYLSQDNDRIYTLAQSLNAPSVEGITFKDKVILEDYVVTLSADGKELDKLSILEALANSSYRDLVARRASSTLKKGDMTHTNSIMRLDAEMAKHFPMFKEGDLLVSMRSLSMIGVIDMEQKKFIWGARVGWKQQHDAEFAADGYIYVFDNKGLARRYSRIMKLSPVTMQSETVYGNTGEQRFYTSLCGAQQLLPNGNLLITEANKRRIFEVTSEGNIVWQFVGLKGPSCMQTAKRYAARDIPFLAQKLH